MKYGFADWTSQKYNINGSLNWWTSKIMLIQQAGCFEYGDRDLSKHVVSQLSRECHSWDGDGMVLDNMHYYKDVSLIEVGEVLA